MLTPYLQLNAAEFEAELWVPGSARQQSLRACAARVAPFCVLDGVLRRSRCSAARRSAVLACEAFQSLIALCTAASSAPEAMQLKDKTALTRAERHIVEKPMQAKALRQALINLEAAKVFVRFCQDCETLRLSQFVNLDQVLAVTIEPETRQEQGVPLLSAMSLMETYTFVILGPPGLGKTALARAMANLQCQARKLPYWVETNTADRSTSPLCALLR
eukprot:15475668-Alexandrium_andersonii.AAC.2